MDLMHAAHLDKPQAHRSLTRCFKCFAAKSTLSCPPSRGRNLASQATACRLQAFNITSEPPFSFPAQCANNLLHDAYCAMCICNISLSHPTLYACISTHDDDVTTKFQSRTPFHTHSFPPPFFSVHSAIPRSSKGSRPDTDDIDCACINSNKREYISKTWCRSFHCFQEICRGFGQSLAIFSRALHPRINKFYLRASTSGLDRITLAMGSRLLDRQAHSPRINRSARYSASFSLPSEEVTLAFHHHSSSLCLWNHTERCTEGSMDALYVATMAILGLS